MATKRNYKVYAFIGADANSPVRKLVVLDTGAGPNFIRKNELSPELQHRTTRCNPLPDIRDANGRQLRLDGTIILTVQLGGYSVRAEFIVCERLAASAIFGADFCDRFVEAILPRLRQIELVDGTRIPITRRPLKRAPKAPPLPDAQNYDYTPGRASPKLRVSRATKIPPESQAWVMVSTERVELAVLQPLAMLYSSYGLAISNGVATVVPKEPFWILVANFSRMEQWLKKVKWWVQYCPTQQLYCLVRSRSPTSSVLYKILLTETESQTRQWLPVPFLQMEKINRGANPLRWPISTCRM